MTKKIDNIIFISGSRAINQLNSLNEDFIENCILKDKKILIWDADGVDFLVQEYLFKKKYTNVTVFTVNKKPRNNVWNFI